MLEFVLGAAVVTKIKAIALIVLLAVGGAAGVVNPKPTVLTDEAEYNSICGSIKDPVLRQACEIGVEKGIAQYEYVFDYIDATEFEGRMQSIRHHEQLLLEHIAKFEASQQKDEL